MWTIWDRKDKFFLTEPMTPKEADAWLAEHRLPRYIAKRVAH